MTYTFDQLKEDVRKEAEALRVHATQKELARLDLQTLQPGHLIQDVYGQMTGHTSSERAVALISVCAPEMYDYNKKGYTKIGRVKKDSVASFYTPIQYWSGLPEARNANLI